MGWRERRKEGVDGRRKRRRRNGRVCAGEGGRRRGRKVGEGVKVWERGAGRKEERRKHGCVGECEVKEIWAGEGRRTFRG